MATWRDEVVLEDDFFLFPKKKVLHRVTLTKVGLFINLNNNSSTAYEEKTIFISDIIGCHCLEQNGNSATNGNTTNMVTQEDEIICDGEERNSPEHDKTSADLGLPRVSDPSTAGFVVFAYPLKKKMLSSKKVRRQVVLSFEVPASEKGNKVFEQRRSLAEKWKNIINCLCRELPIKMNDLSSCVPPPRGKFLVLINPHSGPGKAHSIFKNEVAHMLLEAGIPFKVYITEYAGHASDLMKNIKLSEWYGVVIVSGDGLIFETVNGIMQRDDWASSIKLPIGCLPGGSGNALCCSINYSAGEPFDSNVVLHSTFVLIKHRVIPMDLVAVHIPNKTIFSFLSITWGIVADIDFESEKYRNLGEARFTVGAIRRIMGLRTYAGKVSFLPVAEYVPKESPHSGKKKVLSKIRRLSLRSFSGSKSTLNSSGEGSSPKLNSHRALSFDNGDVHMRTQDTRKVSNISVSGSAVDGQGDAGAKSSIDGLNGHKAMVGDGEHCTGNERVNGNTNKVVSHELVNSQSENGTTVSFYGAQEETSATDSGSKVQDSSEDKAFSTETDSSVEKLYTANGNGKIELVPKRQSGSNTSSPQTAASDEMKNCFVESNHSMTVLEESEEVDVEEETYLGTKADFAPVPTPLLSPLDEAVPENWITLEGDFVLVCGVYQTHLGSDMLAAPNAHLHDGFIHLMMVREGISRNTLLNLFLSFGEGGHVHSPYVEMVKVLAFRLEPESTQGNMMVDGERFPPSPLQAQVLPGLARIMAIQ